HLPAHGLLRRVHMVYVYPGAHSRGSYHRSETRIVVLPCSKMAITPTRSRCGSVRYFANRERPSSSYSSRLGTVNTLLPQTACRRCRYIAIASCSLLFTRGSTRLSHATGQPI